jgi:Na+/phosphate symporter
MVAMGTSLSDRAWGRESAVYRITGVLSVIGGWFFTALAAFTFALAAATLIYYGGLVAILVLMALAIYLAYRTHVIHLRRSDDRTADLSLDMQPHEITSAAIISRSSKNIQEVLKMVITILNDTIAGLADEDRKALKNAKVSVQKLNNTTKRWKTHMSNVLSNLKEDSAETGQYYVQAIDYLREINHCISYIVNPSHEHIENNHKSLITSQIEEISRIQGEITIFIEEIISMLHNSTFEDFDLIVNRQQIIMRLLDESRKKQIKRIKNSETGTRNSVLYLNILAELKNLSLFSVNLLKTERDFLAAAKVKPQEK